MYSYIFLRRLYFPNILRSVVLWVPFPQEWALVAFRFEFGVFPYAAGFLYICDGSWLNAYLLDVLKMVCLCCVFKGVGSGVGRNRVLGRKTHKLVPWACRLSAGPRGTPLLQDLCLYCSYPAQYWGWGTQKWERKKEGNPTWLLLFSKTSWLSPWHPLGYCFSWNTPPSQEEQSWYCSSSRCHLLVV